MCGRIIKIPLHLWENLMKKKLKLLRENHSCESIRPFFEFLPDQNK